MLRSEYAAVCENGLIHVAIFIPWRRVRGEQWREAKDDKMRIVFRSRFRFAWKFEVAGEDRAEVEQVLETVRPKYHGAAKASA